MKNPFETIYQKCKVNAMVEQPDLLLADVELTNLCNLACKMCPVGLNQLMRPRGCMGFDFFLNRIIPQLKQTKCRGIRFVRWGEPTLHPRFTEFLKATKKAGFLCHFNTNGQLFDEELVWAILAYKVDSVKFSFQGLNKYEYTKIRRGGDWDKLLKWIEYLANKRGQGQRPHIEVGTTVTKKTDAGCESFRSQFEDVADAVCIGTTKAIVGNIAGKRVSNYDSTYNPVYRPCQELTKLSINWDGSVSFCCSDYDNMMLMGNLKKQSLPEIWQGEQAKTYRKMISGGKRGLLTLCKSCKL